MIEILIIAYCLFNVLLFGLSSVIMGGSNDSFFAKLIISVIILALGFIGVVLYVLLPNDTVRLLQSRLQKRRASKHEKIISKLKAVK